MSPAAFERLEMVVRLISVSFFDLVKAAATFFDLGWCRCWLITLGGSEEPMLMPTDGEMRSSTREGCAGVSLLAAAISSRSAFANAPFESEMPTVVSARGWTTATALRGGVLSSIAARDSHTGECPTRQRMVGCDNEAIECTTADDAVRIAKAFARRPGYCASRAALIGVPYVA